MWCGGVGETGLLSLLLSVNIFSLGDVFVVCKCFRDNLEQGNLATQPCRVMRSPRTEKYVWSTHAQPELKLTRVVKKKTR